MHINRALESGTIRAFYIATNERIFGQREEHRIVKN